jgi:hypothetical protein
MGDRQKELMNEIGAVDNDALGTEPAARFVATTKAFLQALAARPRCPSVAPETAHGFSPETKSSLIVQFTELRYPRYVIRPVPTSLPRRLPPIGREQRATGK